jgi:hypothetical protein
MIAPQVFNQKPGRMTPGIDFNFFLILYGRLLV